MSGVEADYDALLGRAMDDLVAGIDAVEPPDVEARWVPGGGHAAYRPIGPLAMAHFDPLSARRGDDLLWAKLERSLDALNRMQHDDGLIDLQTSNFHSPPDTAFMVEELAVLYEVIRNVAAESGRRERLLERLRSILVAACNGIAGGGIHTPNHRWKAASALMLGHSLWPHDTWRAEAEAYLDEGIDINTDGEFTERSTGCYNEVNDRSLLLLARVTGRDEYADHVDRNLEHMLRLLHADGTLVTTYSRRQDRHTTVGVERYLHLYWLRAMATGNGRFLSAADLALGRIHASRGSLASLPIWLRYFDDLAGAAPPEPESLPDDYDVSFDGVGVRRFRRGKLSLTLMERCDDCLAVRSGDGPEVTVRVATGLAPAGQFLAEVDGADGRYRLTQRQQCEYFGPGPDALPAVDWRNRPAFSRRVFASTSLDIELTVKASDAGVDLHLRADGCERVPIEVAFIIRDATSIDLDGEAERDDDERKHFLNAGRLICRGPHRAVHIGPGVCEHTLTAVPTGRPHPLPNAWCLRPVTPTDLALSIRVDSA